MRVTNKMMAQSLVNNINTNMRKLDKYQNQMTSGEKINRPSDDPIAAVRLLNTKSALNAQEQYSRNMKDAIGWLDTADVALGNANDVLQRARVLAATGSTATTPPASLAALAGEVDNLVGELLQVANTNYAGRYMFGGGKTAGAPFAITGQDGPRITAVGFIQTDFTGFTAGEIDQQLNQIYSQQIEIEAGVTVDISAGKMTFHSDVNGENSINAIFEKLIGLRTALDAGDKDAVGSMLEDIDKMIDNVLAERAVVGAKVNRMESAVNRNTTLQLHLTDLLGKLADTNYAEASTAFKSQQAVYEAALAVSARIIQPSLLNFLK